MDILSEIGEKLSDIEVGIKYIISENKTLRTAFESCLVDLKEEKETGDRYYGVIRELAGIYELDGWTIENIIEKAKNSQNKH